MRDYYGIPFSHMNRKQWIFLFIYVTWLPLASVWSIEFMLGMDMIPGGNLIRTFTEYRCISGFAYDWWYKIESPLGEFSGGRAAVNGMLAQDKCGIRRDYITMWKNGISYPIP